MYFSCLPGIIGNSLVLPSKYTASIFTLNNRAIWLVNKKPQTKQMHCRIAPRRTCYPCGSTMKIGSRYHRILIHYVKRTTKMYGMGPSEIRVLKFLIIVQIHLNLICIFRRKACEERCREGRGGG